MLRSLRSYLLGSDGDHSGYANLSDSRSRQQDSDMRQQGKEGKGITNLKREIERLKSNEEHHNEKWNDLVAEHEQLKTDYKKECRKTEDLRSGLGRANSQQNRDHQIPKNLTRLNAQHREELQQYSALVKRERNVSAELRQQIIQYKTQISASSRPGPRITDDDVSRGMNELFHRVQSWAIDIVLKSKPGEIDSSCSFCTAVNVADR